MAKIKFGVSGWRAIIAEDFTFENARRVTAAIAELVGRLGRQPCLIVGYETRFLAVRFAKECAELLSVNGFWPSIASRRLQHRSSPTRSCVINFTASHNPGEY
jgi:phosphoglucomutase